MTNYFIMVPYNTRLQSELKLAYQIKWNPDEKLWYTNDFSRYNSVGLKQFHIVYYNVPFALKNEAKAAGFKWNHVKKQWYACSYITTNHPVLMSKIHNTTNVLFEQILRPAEIVGDEPIYNLLPAIIETPTIIETPAIIENPADENV